MLQLPVQPCTAHGNVTFAAMSCATICMQLVNIDIPRRLFPFDKSRLFKNDTDRWTNVINNLLQCSSFPSTNLTSILSVCVDCKLWKDCCVNPECFVISVMKSLQTSCKSNHYHWQSFHTNTSIWDTTGGSPQSYNVHFYMTPISSTSKND